MGRLRAEIWVGAYLRRVFAAGAAAYVVRRGDGDAGAIFIHLVAAEGERLFVPAPIWQGAAEERLWSERAVAAGADGPAAKAIEAVLAAEARRDPDIWIIEIEDRAGRHFLDEALTSE